MYITTKITGGSIQEVSTFELELKRNNDTGKDLQKQKTS